MLPALMPVTLSAVNELRQAAAIIAAVIATTPSEASYLERSLSELLHAGIIEIGPEYHDRSSLSQAKP